MAGKQDDPLTKIAAMMDEKIKAALEGRERAEAESKDPWKRFEGMVDRAVAKHFEEFRRGLEDPEEDEDKAGGKPKDDEEGFLSLFGGGRR